MTDKIKQLETEIVYLKARAFELTESKSQSDATISQLQQILTRIADTVGVASADGTVSVEQLYAAIDALIPVQEEAEV